MTEIKKELTIEDYIEFGKQLKDMYKKLGDAHHVHPKSSGYNKYLNRVFKANESMRCCLEEMMFINLKDDKRCTTKVFYGGE